MHGIPLNIVGSEWIIIIFVALVLILGTGRLPEAARKLGRATAEFQGARRRVESEMNPSPGSKIRQVETEREKLEVIADSLGIPHRGVPTERLRDIIQSRIGGRRDAPDNPG